MNNNTISTAMIDIFRNCPRAYFLGLYYAKFSVNENTKPLTTLKKCLLQGIAHINLQNITTLAQVQKYVGKYFPESVYKSRQLTRSQATESFFYVYHCLKNYLNNQYIIDGFEKVGVAAKLKSRVALAQIYLEDTLDLVLWNPKTKTLEVVDFVTKAPRYSDGTWPSLEDLVMTYLSQKLKLHYPYENLIITKYTLCNKMPDDSKAYINQNLMTETQFELHYPQLVQNLIQMNDLTKIKGQEYSKLLKQPCDCKLCYTFNQNLAKMRKHEISA